MDDFARKAPGGQDTGARYETRVLEGIWAAAPYLHNGSVPSLAELLKPANERVASFKVGPAYDKENVGLAVDQPKFDYTLQTTGCDAPNSGNSRCGHEYGTQLKPDEKKALLEYLKTSLIAIALRLDLSCVGVRKKGSKGIRLLGITLPSLSGEQPSSEPQFTQSI